MSSHDKMWYLERFPNEDGTFSYGCGDFKDTMGFTDIYELVFIMANHIKELEQFDLEEELNRK